jgi:hypothetical protein
MPKSRLPLKKRNISKHKRTQIKKLTSPRLNLPIVESNELNHAAAVFDVLLSTSELSDDLVVGNGPWDFFEDDDSLVRNDMLRNLYHSSARYEQKDYSPSTHKKISPPKDQDAEVVVFTVPGLSTL